MFRATAKAEALNKAALELLATVKDKDVKTLGQQLDKLTESCRMRTVSRQLLRRKPAVSRAPRSLG